MKKAISILSLAFVAATGLAGCSKSAEQNVTTENVSNLTDVGLDNAEAFAPNATDPSALENVGNTAP